MSGVNAQLSSVCPTLPTRPGSSGASNQFKKAKPPEETARWGGGLKRRTPLKRVPFKRKKPLWARSKHPKAWCPQEREKPKPKAALRRESDTRAREKRRYYKLQAEFLETHVVCGICLARGEEKPRMATEVHHLRGRGRLLCDTRFFVSSCFECREWPHKHPSQARELGILAGPAEWNVVPLE